jgi:hypothetical protein
MRQRELALGDDPRDMQLLKHVNAVAIMPTKDGGRISAFERRLFNVLLYWAQSCGDEPEYSARLHEVARLSGFTSHNTAELKKALKKLMKTVVEWQSPTRGEIEDWEASVLLSGASIKKDRASGAVTLNWRYDRKIQAQLLAPDRYARLALAASIVLRTHPAMVLHEICARYVDNPGRRTARRHWRWWRPVLGGVAYEEGSGEYRYWKRDVLIPAVAEINANTELEVTGPIEYKEQDNRTIADIQFEVRLKSRERLAAPAPALGEIRPEDLEVVGKAIDLGLPQSGAEKIVRTHGKARARRALTELERRKAMPDDVAGPVRDPERWVQAVLTSSTSTAQDPPPPPIPALEPRELQRSKVALQEEWLRRKKDELRALFQELPSSEQVEILARFRETLRVGPILRRFDNEGWNHRMIRDTFATFLGNTWNGPGWSTPPTEEILALALEQRPAVRADE